MVEKEAMRKKGFQRGSEFIYRFRIIGGSRIGVPVGPRFYLRILMSPENIMGPRTPWINIRGSHQDRGDPLKEQSLLFHLFRLFVWIESSRKSELFFRKDQFLRIRLWVTILYKYHEGFLSHFVVGLLLVTHSGIIYKYLIRNCTIIRYTK